MLRAWQKSAAALAGTAILVAGCVTAVSERRAEAPPAAQKISMQAMKFDYIPDEITVKKGKPVDLSLSTLDRSHGFSAPDLGLRAEIWPGKDTVVHFVPEKAGTFIIQCSIFCGEGHEGMDAKIIVEE